jgi:uncharacterized protein involved in oxidation of intracellular sulfur
MLAHRDWREAEGHEQVDAPIDGLGKTPDGYYNLERMLKRFTIGTHKFLLCGTCIDARGLAESELLDGARRSSMDELARATFAADKVVAY